MQSGCAYVALCLLCAEQEDHGQVVQHDPSKDNVTVFVSNLDFQVPEDRLRDVFDKVG